MKKLATSLEVLYKAIEGGKWDQAEARLRKDVTGQFIKITEIVSYDGCPCYGSEDENDKEYDKEYDEGDDEEDDEEGEMEMDDQSNENTKTPGKLEENKSDDGSSRSNDNDSTSGSIDDGTGDNGSEIEGEKRKEDADGNSNGTRDDQNNDDQNKVPGNDTVTMSNADSAGDEYMIREPERKDMERKDIAAYVEFMKNKGLHISEGSMTGKLIKAALDLAVVPKLCSKEKNYFYVMQSESLDTIKEKYKEVSPDMANDGKRDLITMFAKFLKQLKESQWHNSIDDLP